MLITPNVGQPPSRRWNQNETSPGMGLQTAQPRRTRRMASQATPSPAAAPSAPACPPPRILHHATRRTAASPPRSGATLQGSNESERAAGLAVAYLGEEQRVEEAGEEEEGAGEEHHGKPQSRSHQTRRVKWGDRGWEIQRISAVGCG